MKSTSWCARTGIYLAIGAIWLIPSLLWAQLPQPLFSDSSVAGRSLFEKPSRPGDFNPAGAYGKLPLSFAPNVGQNDAEVSFTAQGDGYSLFLTRHGVLLALQQPEVSAVPLKDPRS